MSVSSVGGLSPQPVSYPSQSAANDAKKAEQGSPEELTTVTTKCNKKHWHDQSCPHTVSTRPAPKPGELGSRLDEQG